jgi:hypothetical protein
LKGGGRFPIANRKIADRKSLFLLHDVAYGLSVPDHRLWPQETPVFTAA